MPDLECRVAKLEENLANLRRELSEDKMQSDNFQANLCKKLDDLNEAVTKQKGFLGGVVFTASALFSFVAWFFTNKNIV